MKELYQNKIAQEKEMLLKNNSAITFIFAILFFFSFNTNANENQNAKAVDYLKKLKFFSTSFIQDDETSLSDGKIFIGENRIRVEYYNPVKILIILDKNKAMYYNYDLDEDEFFDPRDTSAWFFFDIFFNPEFFFKAKATEKNSYLELVSEGFNNEEIYKIKVLFEKNPFVIRKIILNQNDASLTLSFFDHKYNNSYDKDFFKLINPTFFD